MLPKIHIKDEIVYKGRQELKLVSASLRPEWKPVKKEALLWDEILGYPVNHIWVGSSVEPDLIVHYYRSLTTGGRRVWGNLNPKYRMK